MTFLFCGKVTASLLEIVFTVEKSYYLTCSASSPEESTASLNFLKQLHSSSKTNEGLHEIVVKNMRGLLDLLLEKLIHADDKATKAIESLVKLIVSDLRKCSDNSLLRYVLSCCYSTLSFFSASSQQDLFSQILSLSTF